MPSRPTRPATSSGEEQIAPSPGEPPHIRVGSREVFVGVRVSPSTARTALRGIYGDRLKVSLTAPPEDGRANRQLEEALAKWLELPLAQVRVDTGHGSRDKVVAFAGIDGPELRSRLVALLGDAGRAR